MRCWRYCAGYSGAKGAWARRFNECIVKGDFNTVGGRLHNPKKTHLQAYRDLYRLYRQEIGEESFLLACTGFTRAVVGLADACRIGPDAGWNWHAAHPCCIRDCIPAVANSAFANGVLYANDPDVTYTLPAGSLRQDELRVWRLTLEGRCRTAAQRVALSFNRS